MQLVSIAQIRAMDADDVIPGVSGTVTAVGKATSGKGAKKSWTRQNFDLTQGKDTLRVVVWNRAEPIPDSWKGKKVTVLSTDQDAGITGVFAGDNDYQGKVTREIKVQSDQGGEVALGGSGAAGENADGAGQEPAPKPENPAATSPASKQPNPFAAGVFGGTVGHAEKLTFDALEKIGIEMFLDENTVNPKWLKMFWIGSSAIIRVSRTLEDGKLAPKPEVAPVAQAKPLPFGTNPPKPAATIAQPVAGDEPLEADEIPM